MEIKEKIEKRCNLILDYLAELDVVLPEDASAYHASPLYRNAAERLCEKIVDASTDIVALLCKIEEVPSIAIFDFAPMVHALEQKALFPSSIAAPLIELYGFKNRILYNYGDSETESAYEILISDFIPFYERFVEFMNEKILLKL